MDEIHDSFPAEVVTEMANGISALVPLDPQVVEEITKGDDDPVFATFTIEPGWSGSRRYWPDEVVAKIAEQVNSSTEPVVGFMGHIKPEDDGFSFPEIQMHWLRAKVAPSSDKVKLLVKGYALPGTKGREYLKRKLVKVVSVNGNAVLSPMQGGVRVSEFDLESIDLSRPKKSGMKTQLVSITQEMEGSVKTEEIAALTANDLRTHNPNLVKQIEDEAKKPVEEKVSEMERAAEEVKPQADLISEIRKALGIDESTDILEVLGTTMTKLKEAGKTVRDRMFDEVLGKKFKDEATRSLVRRVLVSEMSSIDESEEKLEEKITEMVDGAIEKDEALKALLTRGGGHSVSGNGEDNRTTDKIEAGFENDYIKVRKVRA